MIPYLAHDCNKNQFILFLHKDYLHSAAEADGKRSCEGRAESFDFIGTLPREWFTSEVAICGGIFVLPTIGNPVFYFLALVIGSAVGMLLLAILKRPIKDNT